MKPSPWPTVCLAFTATLLCHCQPSSPNSSPGPAVEQSAAEQSVADHHADRIEYVRAFLDAELGSSEIKTGPGWSEIDRERTATMIAALSMHEVWGVDDAFVPTTSQEARTYLAELRLRLDEKLEDEAVWRLKLFADALQEMSDDGLRLVPEMPREEE